MARAPRQVPQRFGGATRAAYQHGYAKSAANHQTRVLKGAKLRPDAPRQQPRPRDSKRDYAKDAPNWNVDFGSTGFVDD